MFYFEKGNINAFFEENRYKRLSDELINEVLNEVKKRKSINTNTVLEISNFYSDAISRIYKETKDLYFISCSSFEALLAYFFSTTEGYKINSFSLPFIAKAFESLHLAEKFEIIYSILGLSFNEIYNLIQEFLAFLKIEGYLFLVVPAYWYLKDNLTEIEKVILNYSKQNDKKWIFVEELHPVIKRYNAEVIEIIELKNRAKLTRYDLAVISSLEKLKEAEEKTNLAHLEITNIPEKDIEIRTALIVIKKLAKTLTKETLFKF